MQNTFLDLNLPSKRWLRSWTSWRYVFYNLITYTSWVAIKALSDEHRPFLIETYKHFISPPPPQHSHVSGSLTTHFHLWILPLTIHEDMKRRSHTRNKLKHIIHYNIVTIPAVTTRLALQNFIRRIQQYIVRERKHSNIILKTKWWRQKLLQVIVVTIGRSVSSSNPGRSYLHLTFSLSTAIGLGEEKH